MATFEELRTLFTNENKIAVMTVDGLRQADADEFAAQDYESLLYDLNRDFLSLQTVSEGKSLRWVNDLATINVIKVLKDSNNRLYNAINSATAENAKLLDKISLLNDKLEKSNAELSSLQENNNGDELEKLKTRLNKATEVFATQKKEIDSYKTTIQELRSENDDISASNETLTNDIDALKNENTKLSEQLADVDSNYNDLKKDYDKLAKELNAVNTKYAEAKSNFNSFKENVSTQVQSVVNNTRELQDKLEVNFNMFA